jgi:acetylornithine deacetylase/succinyl-diaminopimelate desuccinylase family protein
MTDALCAAIDARHAAQVAFLAELVRVPSDNPPGDCQPAADRLAALLEALGFTVERNRVSAERLDAAGMVSATNLIVRQQFGAGGPTVALNAHGDVVPPGEGWTTDPYGAEIRDGVMYGRGVAVSKSDFATYAFAMAALRDSDLKLAGTLELHCTYDEETGGAIGPQLLLEQGLTKPDYAISAGFAYNVTIAHNGCLHLEVELIGRSAHAARPDTGLDALEAAAHLLTALYGLRDGYAKIQSSIAGITHPSLVVGKIAGGINTNVVPDSVVLRLDRRIIPEENPAEVEQALTGFIEQVVAQTPGIGVRIRRVLLALPFTPMPGQARLVELLQRHGQAILGTEIKAEGVPLYTDARHYSAAGIPTVLYGAGPRSLLEANGHRADERLVLTDLLAATKVVALTLAELLAAG